MQRLVYLSALLAVAFLSGCGGGGGGSGPGATINGVAATGVALDGADVEVRDSAGNIVDVGAQITGFDGSYSVTLPSGVNLPVLIRIIPTVGDPIRTIVAEPAGGVSGDITANVNPVTELVSQGFLGPDSTTPATIAVGLAVVTDAAYNQAGDVAVDRLLGADVDFATFSTDPFVAETGDAAPASPADAILEVLMEQAQEAGQPLDDFLIAEGLADARLLEDAAFQVDVVVELRENGTLDTDLLSELESIGAVPAIGGELFAAVIATVPGVIDQVTLGAADIADPALVDVVIDAALDLMANTIEERSDRLSESDTDLAATIATAEFTSVVVSIVDNTITPIVNAAEDSGQAALAPDGLQQIVDTVVEETATVLTAVVFDDADGVDVTTIVTDYINAQVVPDTPAIIADQLDEVQADPTVADTLVTDIVDASDVTTDLAAAGAPVETLPGRWNIDTWNNFTWG
ncbi:MAG: hypothetical protein O7G84_05610 [Gammaproteobacteria bacterium]|nr:hypothetical protein [Gammaproteobacteria bacterium]